MTPRNEERTPREAVENTAQTIIEGIDELRSKLVALQDEAVYLRYLARVLHSDGGGR